MGGSVCYMQQVLVCFLGALGNDERCCVCGGQGLDKATCPVGTATS
jgi:hypothetical protein